MRGASNMQALTTNDASATSGTVIHKDIKPEVEIREVLRFLGAKGSEASPRTVKKIKSFISETRDMLEPVILESELKVLESEKKTVILSTGVELRSPKLSRTLSKCKKAKVFVATVGKQVEDKINELLHENRYSEAAIMDAIASVAVEDTVESFQSREDMKLKSKSKCTTLRFSPGYCDWDIKEQHKLFDTVKASSIGVVLNKNSLMSPRKTISGIFGIGSTEDVSCKSNNPCMSCGNKDCIARRTES
jgi:hypothetical protein